MKAANFRRIIMYICALPIFGYIVIVYHVANDTKNIANLSKTYCHVFYP